MWTRNISSIAAIGDFGGGVADLVEQRQNWAICRPTMETKISNVSKMAIGPYQLV